MNQISYIGRLFSALAVVASLALSACGGGGGSGGGSSPPVVQPSVSGDMVAYVASRGWNYQGTIFGGQAYTLSVYADPPSGGTDALVLFAQAGTAADAFSGTKAAGLGLQSSAAGYNATAYILFNTDGSTFASGAITGSPLLVPATLTQGASFTSYPGVTATVTFVGAVPGENACPAPTNGATIAYTFMGGNYTVSYVPGCGITHYTGNNGEVMTLVSVGSYPQLGTQSARRMSSLTILDTIRSAARVLVNHQKWQPFAKPYPSRS